MMNLYTHVGSRVSKSELGEFHLLYSSDGMLQAASAVTWEVLTTRHDWPKLYRSSLSRFPAQGWIGCIASSGAILTCDLAALC
jgi:hypothetical protein